MSLSRTCNQVVLIRASPSPSTAITRSQLTPHFRISTISPVRCVVVWVCCLFVSNFLFIYNPVDALYRPELSDKLKYSPVCSLKSASHSSSHLPYWLYFIPSFHLLSKFFALTISLPAHSHTLFLYALSHWTFLSLDFYFPYPISRSCSCACHSNYLSSLLFSDLKTQETREFEHAFVSP